MAIILQKSRVSADDADLRRSQEGRTPLVFTPRECAGHMPSLVSEDFICVSLRHLRFELPRNFGLTPGAGLLINSTEPNPRLPSKENDHEKTAVFHGAGRDKRPAHPR
jgi:hypothetical protein